MMQWSGNSEEEDMSWGGMIPLYFLRGGAFDAWTERFSLARWTAACAEEGIDAIALATEPRDTAAPLPWDHISAGVDREYLLEERDRALAAETTPDCSFDGCTSCGVCPSLGVDIVLGGGSRG